MIILITLGSKFRNLFPKAKTLIEVIRLKFGKQLFKLILFLTIFYMAIFLIAEVTAVSILVNYISGTSLWVTALVVVTSSLVYTLYGGLRASIFTDSIQFIVFIILLVIAISFLVSFNSTQFNFEFINSIASIVPIGAIILLSTFIFCKSLLSNKSSSLLVPDFVISIAG